jgi:hypothetical protein
MVEAAVAMVVVVQVILKANLEAVAAADPLEQPLAT